MTYLKLYQGCIFGIIILAISCAVHSRNETSVNWTIHGSVQFGNTTILHCRIDRKFNVCEHVLHIRRWTKYQTQTILTFDEISSNETKYKGKVNKHCTTSSLHIHNFGPSDFGVYTCSFGHHSKEIRLDRSNQSKENIVVHMLCSKNHLELEVEMQETFPTPLCYVNITNNFKTKNRIVHTNITGLQYLTQDKTRYELKDHSCSGVIQAFCLFGKMKVEVFNRTYNCCKDRHVSWVLIVPVGCAIIISFVVSVFLVYLFKMKKKGICRKEESMNVDYTSLKAEDRPTIFH